MVLAIGLVLVLAQNKVLLRLDVRPGDELKYRFTVESDSGIREELRTIDLSFEVLDVEDDLRTWIQWRPQAYTDTRVVVTDDHGVWVESKRASKGRMLGGYMFDSPNLQTLPTGVILPHEEVWPGSTWTVLPIRQITPALFPKLSMELLNYEVVDGVTCAKIATTWEQGPGDYDLVTDEIYWIDVDKGWTVKAEGEIKHRAGDWVFETRLELTRTILVTRRRGG